MQRKAPLVAMMEVAALALPLFGEETTRVHWQHPVGEFDLTRLRELSQLAQTQEWAADYVRARRERASRWMDCAAIPAREFRTGNREFRIQNEAGAAQSVIRGTQQPVMQ